MTEKEILALEDKRFSAMIARDFKALEAMLHGDLLYTHSSGVTDTKATWLQSMQSGKTKYKSVNCTDRKVRVIGEVALVTGRAAIEAEIGGQPRSLKLLFLNAWTKTPQGWKFVAWQSTPLERLYLPRCGRLSVRMMGQPGQGGLEVPNRLNKEENMTVDRRSVLEVGLVAAAVGSFSLAAAEIAAAQSSTKTYVLVHGAWHGGWCWKEVAEGLRGMGHRVSTPTQTGLGERKHLLSKDITLETFAADIVNHVEAEELNDVILVGHSFGGTSITGAADKISNRIRHLVYLDSVILENGQSVFSVLPPDVVAARRKIVAEQGQGIFIPPPPPTAFGIPENHASAEWVKRRLTPHPVGTYDSPMQINNPVGNGRPRTYIACTNPLYGPLEGARQWVKKQENWNWQEIATGHDAMVTAPAELARMLATIG